MIEVELKLPIYKRSATEAALVREGFEAGDLVKEYDLYFTGSSRDFIKSDEALRIRSSENLTRRTSKSFLTYKGRKLDCVSMTRKELETPIGDTETMKEILISLGYEDQYPVSKLRQYYHKTDVTACVDQVEGLGSFRELEILVPEKAGTGQQPGPEIQHEAREKALARLETILDLLGFSLRETTSRSYLSMIMDRNKKRS